MTVLRAALLLGCLLAAAGQAVDKYGNPCLPGGTLPPKQMPVGGQVALGLGATAAAALAGGVAVIEANPKMQKSLKKTAGNVQTAIEKAFTTVPPPKPPRAHQKNAALVVRRTVKFGVTLPPNMPAAVAVTNPAVVKAVVDDIAADTGLAASLIVVKLTAVTGVHLADAGRRLAVTSLQADIEASIPATNSGVLNQQIASKLNAITPAELSQKVQIVVTPTTTPAVTVTPWDFSSGSGGVPSASVNSASFKTSSGSGSSYSSGSNASGSSGFYMSIELWLLLIALAIGGVAAFCLQKKPKRRLKKSAPAEPAPVVETGAGAEQDYLLPPLVPPLEPFVAEVQAGYSMVSPAAQQEVVTSGNDSANERLFIAPAAMITPRTIATSGYNYAADYTTPPMPGPYTTAYAPSVAAPVQVQSWTQPAPYVIETEPTYLPAGPSYVQQAAASQVMAAPMVTEVQRQITPQAATAPARGGIRGTMTSELFNAIDNNRDGVITRAEFREAIAGNIIRVPGQ